MKIGRSRSASVKPKNLGSNSGCCHAALQAERIEVGAEMPPGPERADVHDRADESSTRIADRRLVHRPRRHRSSSAPGSSSRSWRDPGRRPSCRPAPRCSHPTACGRPVGPAPGCAPSASDTTSAGGLSQCRKEGRPACVRTDAGFLTHAASTAVRRIRSCAPAGSARGVKMLVRDDFCHVGKGSRSCAALGPLV